MTKKSKRELEDIEFKVRSKDGVALCLINYKDISNLHSVMSIDVTPRAKELLRKHGITIA